MAGKITTEIDNYMAIVHDLAAEAEVWLSRPAWLEFAPNNVCNLRCIMCGQADGEPLLVMKKEDAVKFLDDVLPSTSLWTPSALSEPMLANMALVIEKCREHEVWLNFYSNATLLDGKRFRGIADRIQKLHISFDSHEKAVFESLRVRADFDTVVANIKEVLPIATEMGVPVGFVAVLMADNLAHLAEFVDFLADIGAAKARSDIRVQPMLYNSKGCAGRNVTDRFTEAEIAHELDRACERARARGINLYVDFDLPLRREVTVVPPHVRGIMPDMLTHMTETIRERYPHFCRMASYYLKVTPDGKVFPCCRAPHELEMGNVHEEPIEKIWNGERYRTFRKRMFTGDYPNACRSCSFLVENPAFEKRHEVRAGARPTGERVNPG
jgi:radical SAM protein with 4Fe4S-binding SPASM domain